LSETIRQDRLIDFLRQQGHYQQNNANDNGLGQQACSERASDALPVRLIEHETDFARSVRFRAYGQMGGLDCRPLMLFALGRKCH
jgi:hypothetical protein